MSLSLKKTWLCYDASTMIAYVKFTTFSRNAKTGLSQYGFNPFFVLKPRPQDGVYWNKPSVNLIKYLYS